MSSWRSSPTTERLALARILGAKGLDGALRIELLTDWPEHLALGARVFVDGDPTPREIVDVERGGRVRVVRLSGIEGRAAAHELVGRYLEAPAAGLPEGSYYWHQLVGLDVYDENGRRLGELVEVFRAGENEVYRVDGPGGELLVPGLREVVREIDLEAGRMTVRYDSEEVR